MIHESAHARSIEEVRETLDTNLAQGLTEKEAQRRLDEHGLNELREVPPPSIWELLLDQFDNFVVLILIAAAVVSLFLGKYLESGAILAIVVLNAVLGVIQERKAEDALRALKKMAAPEAHVLRGGHRVTVPSREVVPGDVVFLDTGNYVPADVRLIESVNLQIDESSLTGESVPATKKAAQTLEQDTSTGDRKNMGYRGTIVTYGRGKGVVTATGMETEIGQIAEMIQSYEEEQTPLQQKLDQAGKMLGAGMLVICGIIFVVGFLRGLEVLEMFIVAVSLAIAAVPEGLPAVVTITLALGMQEMIQRNALIRKLPAVETLGSATTICSDKTGTLTQNEMTVVRIYTDNTVYSVSGEGYKPEGAFHLNGSEVHPREDADLTEALKAGALCNDARLERREEDGHVAWRLVGDPTEGALVVASAKADLWKADLEDQYPRVSEIPFEAERKRMTTVHRQNGHYVAYVKGAPDILLDLCSRAEKNGEVVSLDESKRNEILQKNEEMTAEALRVLAVAYRPLEEAPEAPHPDDLEQDLIFLGLIGMRDPARPEVKRAIEKARQAGIRTVMVTGDYKNTARAIAEELDILRPSGRVVPGPELEKMSDDELASIIDEVDVFARVSPEHKVRIVQALREAKGEVVAMTGDGVNDAPALKRADIGVAMGITGTDVSKQTADMVLTDDNYASIVSAVEQGRVIYSNIRKFVYYLLSCNMAEIAIIFLATMLGWPLPLTAIQLLWLNLVTDGAPALALGMEQGEPDIMEQRPRPKDEPIINRLMIRGIGVQTIAITAITLMAFGLGRRWFADNLVSAQTMAFVTLSISELFRAYTSRSERYPLLRIGLFGNRQMQYAVTASIALILAVIYVPFLNPIFGTVPLELREWMAIIPLVLVPAIVAEINKLFIGRRPPHGREKVPSQGREMEAATAEASG